LVKEYATSRKTKGVVIMDWRIVIRPLLEKNMFNAKEGEIILDKNTGHVTFKHNGKFRSMTKELEARVNALLGYKNQLVKKYIELSDLIDILVTGFDTIYDQTTEVFREAEELYSQLVQLDYKIQNLMTQIDAFCLEIKNFQYREIRPYLDPIVDNLKSLILIRANLDELAFLAKDIADQKVSNRAGIDVVGGGY
jgi:hypothetical protein